VKPFFGFKMAKLSGAIGRKRRKQFICTAGAKNVEAPQRRRERLRRVCREENCRLGNLSAPPQWMSIAPETVNWIMKLAHNRAESVRFPSAGVAAPNK
jgi:hypothetical protein